MMVDRILKDSGEVYGSDDEDLSGDEIKSPVFVITKAAADNAANREDNPEDGNEEMDEDAEDLMEKDGELFVQEEYDLASNLDMMVSRLDSFDEFKFFADTAKQFHLQNSQLFQEIMTKGL